MRFLKQLKEKAECKKLAKEFNKTKKLLLNTNEQKTKDYIAGEYVMYCILNHLPINDIEGTVKYAFQEGIKKGMIDKHTLTLITE